MTTAAILTPNGAAGGGQKGGGANGSAPHLSFSRVNRYLTCPEQYRLYYIEGWRPRVPSASLIFGQNIHAALAHHFQTGADPVAFFEPVWREARDMKLQYSGREDWEKLAERGKLLLAKFMAEERPRLTRILAAEKPFELSVSDLDVPFVGVIDLVAEMENEKIVLDFKTAAGRYEDHEVEMSDQLTAYSLAEPDARRVALCVLVKTKEPKIEWHFSRRTGDRLVEFLGRVGLVGEDIARGRFYRRPGKHCSWCDFLPICLGDNERVAATLARGAE